MQIVGLLPVTYFLTNLVDPFTLRFTGITRKNAIVEYFDYQEPVTQLKGPKKNGDMQTTKRDLNAPPTRDLNIWLSTRHTDLSVTTLRSLTKPQC